MPKAISIVKKLVIFLVLVGLILVFFSGYSYLFSRKVTGEITGVKHLVENMTLMTNADNKAQPPSQIFSFAVGVKDRKTGEIVTGSTEDRQWGVAQPGQCATAEFFPYPPWQLTKAGTYFGVRLLHLYEDCNQLKE